ncbi:5'-3' exoribonuclease 2, partial [Zancudomyces culisetae]
NNKVKIDLERAIDDWVFLCFFVGNDFLPHLPSLEIREGAFDKLVTSWKQSLFLPSKFTSFTNEQNQNGEERERERERDVGSVQYLTNNGTVDIARVIYIFDELKSMESSTFVRRKQNEDYYQNKNSNQNFKSNTPALNLNANLNANSNENNRKAALQLRDFLVASKSNNNNNNNNNGDDEEGSVTAGHKRKAQEQEQEQEQKEQNEEEEDDDEEEDEEEEEEEEEEILLQGGTVSVNDANAIANHIQKQTVVDTDADADADADLDADSDAFAGGDDIRLHEEGYKQRYYLAKFGLDPTKQSSQEYSDQVGQIVTEYIKGLCWVLHYYYHGCVSWSWFYPFHYAPLVSDFSDSLIISSPPSPSSHSSTQTQTQTLMLDEQLIEKIKTFDLSKPITPLEQLMSVLPYSSAKNVLPESLSNLMVSPTSPIISYYPQHFKIDLNGKKHAWQGVAILPFINESTLLAAIQPVIQSLTADQLARNRPGIEMICVGSNNTFTYEPLCDLYSNTSSNTSSNSDLTHRASLTAGNLFGFATKLDSFIPFTTVYSPLKPFGKPDLTHCSYIIASYHLPPTSDTFVASRLLPGVSLPTPTLNSTTDLDFVMSRGRSGYHVRNANRYNNPYHGNNRDYSRYNNNRNPNQNNNSNRNYNQSHNYNNNNNNNNNSGGSGNKRLGSFRKYY